MPNSGLMKDQALVCNECDTPFTFTSAEQVYYADRGLNQPLYCLDCRARKRAARNAELITAYDLVSDFSGTGVWQELPSPYGGHREGSSSGNHPRTRNHKRSGAKILHRATCAACGKLAEVPFKPRAGRPVFCRTCFNQRHRH